MEAIHKMSFNITLQMILKTIYNIQLYAVMNRLKYKIKCLKLIDNYPYLWESNNHSGGNTEKRNNIGYKTRLNTLKNLLNLARNVEVNEDKNI